MLVDGSMKPQYTLFSAASNLAAGLAGGFSGLAAGVAIGIVGDIGTRALGQQPKVSADHVNRIFLLSHPHLLQ